MSEKGMRYVAANVYDNLKPCAFCGCAARLENTVTEAVIRCVASWCGATIKRRHPPQGDDGLKRVIAAWNRQR